MVNARRRGWVWGVVVLASGVGAWGAEPPNGDRPPALEGPATGGDLPPAPPQSEAPVFAPTPEPAPAPSRLSHEAIRAPGERAERVRTPKTPPAPIAERPTDDRPDPRAQWFPGYWAWDPSRQSFVWVAGVWRVPPPGLFWVSGRWVRDARGWSRVPGYWGTPRSPNATASPDWRTAGPPATAPADDPGPAPGPDAFYVPGHYAPQGDRVVWVRGFWARMVAGWDWVPARWLRRPDGWEFRPGYWTRDPSSVAAISPPAPTDRHTVARPRIESDPGADPAARRRTDPNDLPPAIVDSEPAAPAAGADRLPPPPTTTGRDPIAEAEDAARAGMVVPGVPPPVLIGPRVRAPYRMVRPPVVVVPGYGPPPSGRYYDPLNVVPPFVQRFLDRFLP